MFLDTTTRKLQALMAEAVTTTNPMVVADWVDIVVATGGTPGCTPTNLNGVTAVDIVAAPAASTIRKINFLSIYNVDTVAHIVTVRYNDNATLYTIGKWTLAIGDTLIFTDPEGFYIIDSSGQRKAVSPSISGSYIKTSQLVSGTSYTVGSTTRTIFVRLIGGGGGGGGVALNAAGNGTVAGGGAAGGYAEKTFTVIPGTAYTYAIGAAGTAGASGGGTGGTGGDSTFAVGATTVTAKGGLGGTFLATGTVENVALGGAGVLGTNGDLNVAGEPGRTGLIIAAGANGYGGAGGNGVWGGAGAERKTTGAGAAGATGGGGAGALSLASGAAAAGGAGGLGQIIVDEFS